MVTVLLIIIGFIAGICFITPACKHIPECVNLESNYWKKVKRHNVIIIITGGIIGAIIFPLCFTLT